MPYTETHEIEIGPISLPEGVTIDVQTAMGTGGMQAVRITAATKTSKEDTAALLEQAFALLMTAASSEGVGTPVFQSLRPQPVLGTPPAPGPVTQ